jgi:hypothetical protein
MNITQRIKAFASLGSFLKNISQEELQTLTLDTRNQNPWFTPGSVELALNSISALLDEDSLKNWVKNYNFSTDSKKVALVLAGNIPLVGFHDLLSVLIAGHYAQLKMSSKDQHLMKFMIDKLIDIEPEFSERISIEERLKNFDAVIATGSDNTSRYFEYYFGKYPHIIRKNRTSVAVLNGDENDNQLKALGRDVFTYFGLGCRNVSKLFVPENYSFNKLFTCWDIYSDIINHHKYCNNYDYQKSILLVNQQPFLDNGFVILQQSERIVSPISVVYYEFYRDLNDLKSKLEQVAEKIQVTIGKSPLATVDFGRAQQPGLADYADNLDTLKFLSGLK